MIELIVGIIVGIVIVIAILRHGFNNWTPLK